MPQPSHVTDLREADENSLPEDLQPYFAKCRDKLGFVPNVLRAWLLRPAKLRNFIRAYDELMLAPSGLSKLEREMIAVAVSAANRCYYCLVAHGAAVRKLSGDPQLGEMLAFNYRVAELPERQRAMLDFALLLTEAPQEVTAEDRQALAGGGVQRRGHLRHRGDRRVLQLHQPGGARGGHDAERRIPRHGTGARLMASRDGAVARALAGFDGGGFTRPPGRAGRHPLHLAGPGPRGRRCSATSRTASAPGWSGMGFTSTSIPTRATGFGPILVASASRTRRADRAHLRPWRHRARPGGPMGAGARPLDADGARATAGTAAAPPTTRGSTRSTSTPWRPCWPSAAAARLQPQAGAGNGRGARLPRPARVRGRPARPAAADVLIASDGPRVACRHRHHLDRDARHLPFRPGGGTRPGGVHSGNWGGMTTDPAIVLAHAIAAIADRHGRILVPGWLPAGGMPACRARRTRRAGAAGGGRRRHDRLGLGRARLHRRREGVWLDQLHRAGHALRPAGEPGQRRGAQRPGALPDALHRGLRPRRLRAAPCARIWTRPASRRCRSRTPASACPPAAPARKIPGCMARRCQHGPHAGAHSRRSSRTAAAGCPGTCSWTTCGVAAGLDPAQL